MQSSFSNAKMKDKDLACIIKSPVALQLGDTKIDNFRPGVYVIDVTFPTRKPVKIKEISFKNNYSAFLTVRLFKRDPTINKGPSKWITCLRNHCLMPNPHTERGSQDYFSIYRHQMLIEPDNVTSVRLILQQPSSAWLNFNIEEIKMFACLNEDSEKDIPDWLSKLSPVEQYPDLQGLPDPQTVSSSIQQMWALTEVMHSNQNTASIGRFDVDGCYDINLLSYT